MILYVDYVIWLTVAATSNFSGWSCWDDGSRMWLCIRYILLRQSVKMWVSCMWCCVPWIAISMALNLALRVFCKPGSPFAIRRLVAGE